MKYSIIDVESTGGQQGKDKITEIAIFVFDGEKVVDQFQSLVNPQRPIQPFVIQLTGITNEMVADAPIFPEIAKKLVDITEGTVFVAHNVGFDYMQIKNEFKSLGYDYNRKRLCTVNLSRKILPGQASYSLGKLTKALGIGFNDHHRAGADAMATVELFKLLLEKDTDGLIKYSPNSLKNKTQIPIDKLMDLPTEVGVYYLYNQSGTLIYVGKSKNIHDRVFSHLSNVTSKKAVKMASEVVDVNYQLTGSDLMAQLIEATDIKKYLPKFNVAQKQTKINYGLYSKKNDSGYFELRVNKIRSEDYHLGFSTEKEARSYLERQIKDHDLCMCLCGINPKSSSCFTEQLGLCKGAHVNKEGVKVYNKKVEKVLGQLTYNENNVVLPLTGRNEAEQGVVLIKEGHFKGYGFVDIKMDLRSVSEATIKSCTETRDVKLILQKYLKGKVRKMRV